jgi:hypothetical protein
MKSDGSFLDLLESVKQYALPGTTESRAQLHWFLFNVFRLDEIQARDSVCDAPNDKGIDGIWVDEETQEIFLFQSVYTDKAANTLGDKSLREFVGSASWLAHPENLRNLLKGTANDELKALVSSLQLINRLETGYEVKLVFVTTRSLDTNGNEYLVALRVAGPSLEVWDRARLVGQHKNLARKTRVPGKHRFALSNHGIRYEATKNIVAYVVPVRALDVASMQGIPDRSLFALNVRLGLGRTRVNKDLDAALRQKDQHRQFVLFHNGVTIICRKLTLARKQLTVEDYSVVNGCQSAIAFFDNRNYLTPELLVLSRFIEVGDDDALAEDITYRSNNQNGINLRDLRSNDRVQISLKKQFQLEFAGDFQYVIKQGEEITSKESINNDRAGQLVLALYLDEPYNAHQKYRIFGTDYERVFGRSIDPAKIYLAYVLYNAIDLATEKIEDPLIRAYQLTKFVLLGLLGGILRRDTLGALLLENAALYFPRNRTAVEQAVKVVAAQMITDFNFYVKDKQVGEYYDYKSEFKSPEKYRSLSLELQRQFERALVRHPEDSFRSALEARLATSDNAAS